MTSHRLIVGCYEGRRNWRCRKYVEIITCVACVALIVGTLATSYYKAGALFNQYDDAYITFRYAMNLARGNGLVFNVGETTDAASSFLYTLILAACYRLGFRELEIVSTVVNLAAVAGTVAYVYWSCVLRTRSIVVAVLLACVVGFSGMNSGWWSSGMETVFFSFLVSVLVYRMFVRRKLDWGTCIWVCLAALTRLEAVLLVAAYFTLLIREWIIGSAERRRSLTQMSATVVLTVLGFVAVKYALYGTPVPHSFRFKTISGLYQPNASGLWSHWEQQSFALVAFGAAGLFLQPRRFGSWVFGGFAIVTAVALGIGPSADWGRYSVFMVPVLAVLASTPLAAALSASVMAGLVAFAILGLQTMRSYDFMLNVNLGGVKHQSCRKQVGRYIDQTLKPKTPVLSSDIGAIAYAAPDATFIDTIALTSADILQRRLSGEGVDDILARATDGLVADTCHGPCTTFQDYSAYVRLTDPGSWKVPLPRSDYGRNFAPTPPLFSCHTPDGFVFAVSRFTKRN